MIKIDVHDLLQTFDAISLAEKTVDGAAPNSLYAPAIKRLLKPKGLFCITSCNWTEEELVSRFTHTDAGELLGGGVDLY